MNTRQVYDRIGALQLLLRDSDRDVCLNFVTDIFMFGSLSKSSAFELAFYTFRFIDDIEFLINSSFLLSSRCAKCLKIKFLNINSI